MEAEDVKDICASVEKDIRSYMKKNYPQHYKDFFADDSKVLKKTKQMTKQLRVK